MPHTSTLSAVAASVALVLLKLVVVQLLALLWQHSLVTKIGRITKVL